MTGFTFLSRLTQIAPPCTRFVFLGAGFRLGLPSHLASRRRSCLRLRVSTTSSSRDFHPQAIAHAGRTQGCAWRRRWPGVSAGLWPWEARPAHAGLRRSAGRSGLLIRHACGSACNRLPHRPIVLVAAATSRARFARRRRSAFRRPLTWHPLVRAWQR
jgi:hypothetical protein